MRHTPGPWRVELLEHEDTSENLIQCNGTRCIASVDNSDDEDRANAALITAAPELKEMLSLAVCYVDNVEVKNQIYRLLGKIDGVGDTFAKAGGLKRSEAIARKTIDKAYFGKRGAGLLPVFRANEDEGLSLDAMAEILSGYGYPVHEGGNSPYDSTNGSYSPNALEDALIEALNAIGLNVSSFPPPHNHIRSFGATLPPI